MRYAILDAECVVTNVIVADEEIEGLTMIASDTANIGDQHQGDGVFISPPPVVVVPSSIQAYQARLALNAAGLRDAAEAAVAAASRDVRDLWEYAPVLHRAHPALAQLAGAIGLSDAQLDALFVAGARL